MGYCCLLYLRGIIMLKLVFMNITDFIKNKTGIFVFFIFTLIIVSFSGIFIINEVARSTVRESGVRQDYYVEFKESIYYSEFCKLMENSGLSPAVVMCLDENSVKYNSIETGNTESGSFRIFFKGRQLDESDQVGVYCYENNSYYLTSQSELVYGQTLDENDLGKNNAVISYYLEEKVDNGKISVENVEYLVVGCYKDFSGVDVNSISISCETFARNGYKVKGAFLSFELSPLSSVVEKFELSIGENLNMSTASDMSFFSIDTVFLIFKSSILFLIVLVVCIVSHTGVFYCWVNNGKRTYLIYRLCGMSLFKQKVFMLVEMLFYVLTSNIIGTGVFYLILSLGYKRFIYYPPITLVIVNFVLIFSICIITSYIQDRKIFSLANEL